MCANCDEIITSIVRYKKFASEGLDPLTIERITELIAHLESRLAAMHPDVE